MPETKLHFEIPHEERCNFITELHAHAVIFITKNIDNPESTLTLLRQLAVLYAAIAKQVRLDTLGLTENSGLFPFLKYLMPIDSSLALAVFPYINKKELETLERTNE
jgi:hypothetical protein